MGWSRTNQLILAAAERLGVEGRALGSETSDFFVRLRWPTAPEGPREVLISKTRSPFLTQVAQTLSNNKFLAGEQLAARGLPVPPRLLLDDDADPRREGPARAAAAAMLERHEALVVKPNWGNRGIGVCTGVTTIEALERAYAHARALDRDEEALVERELPGINVRVAVIGGRYVAAAQVRRPTLTGDGSTSIRAMVAELNRDPRRGRWTRPGLDPLDRVELEHVTQRFAPLGWTLDDPLPRGQVIELPFEEAEVIDQTDALHPGWARAATDASAALGVDVAGVDLRGPADALFEAGPGRGADVAILEVNASPGLHLHALPTRGASRPVYDAFVAYCLQLPGAPPPCATIELCARY